MIHRCGLLRDTGLSSGRCRNRNLEVHHPLDKLLQPVDLLLLMLNLVVLHLNMQLQLRPLSGLLHVPARARIGRRTGTRRDGRSNITETVLSSLICRDDLKKIKLVNI